MPAAEEEYTPSEEDLALLAAYVPPPLLPYQEPPPAKEYPLPDLGEDVPFNNDNPWDWARLDGLFAYPPKVVQREMRKPKKQPRPNPPVMRDVVEIRCFPKEEPRYSTFPCKCGTEPEDPEYPQFPLKPRLHGKTKVSVRHRRMFNLPTYLVFDRRRLRCRRCNQTFSEEHWGINMDLGVTSALYDDIVRMSIKRPFSDVEALLSVDSDYAQAVFWDHADARLKDYKPTLPAVMGMDENFILGEAAFLWTDLKEATVLDMHLGKEFADLKLAFSRYSLEELNKVEVVVQDMERNFRIFNRINFRKAKIVIDKFHVIGLVNDCMDKARIEFGKDATPSLRKRLSANKFVFLTGGSKLTDEERQRREDFTRQHGPLERAYETKRRFYAIYEQETRAGAERVYENWKDWVEAEPGGYFRPIINTFGRWRHPIFNYFDFKDRYTNGFVENMNGKLRQMNARAAELSFKTLRAKAILRYGRFHGRGEFKAANLRGVPYDRWRHHFGEGLPASAGFSLDDLLADLERGTF